MTKKNPPTFIDLFAGIGGFRLGMENAGFKCVYSADNNKHAALMYETNFGENSFNDVTSIVPAELPDFDVLCAGFPCQPFSNAGRKLGFEDTRGTLFFDLCRIIDEKQPKAVFLENVKNLLSHDEGKTFEVIKKSLHDLGYTVSYKLLDARNYNSPQSRERIVIIAVKGDTAFDFSKIKNQPFVEITKFLSKDLTNVEFLDPTEYTLIPEDKRKTQSKSGLCFVGYRNKNLRINGIRENTEHLSRAHKQPNRIYSAKGSHPTFSSQESSGRYFVLHKDKVRKLTLRECYNMMGFPENFKFVGSNTQLYNRIGNSICVGMVKAVSKELKKQVF